MIETLDEFLEINKSAVRLEIISGLKVIIQTQSIYEANYNSENILNNIYNSGVHYSICFGSYYKIFYNTISEEYSVNKIDEKEFIEDSKTNRLNKLKSLI